MTEAFQPLVQQIIQALLTVLIAFVTYIAALVSSWVKARIDHVKAQIGAEKFSLIERQAQLLVAAAEQMGLKGTIENEGKKKLDWAMAQLDEFAKLINAKVSVESLRASLEAALREGYQKGTSIEVTTNKAVAVSVEDNGNSK